MTNFFRGTQAEFDSVQNKRDGVYLIDNKLKTITNGIIKDIATANNIETNNVDILNILNGIEISGGGDDWEDAIKTAFVNSWSSYTGSGYDIAKTPDCYVKANGTGTYSVATSTDFITWTARSTSGAGTNGFGGLWSVCYNNDDNIAVASGSRNGSNVYIAYSSDFVTWTNYQSTLTGKYGRSIKYYSEIGKYLCGGNGYWIVGSSPTSWVQANTKLKTSSSSADLYAGSCYSPILQKFIVTGMLGSISSSANLVDWTLGTTPVSTNINDVCWCKDSFIAVCNDGILQSYDGDNWTLIQSAIKLNSVDYSDLFDCCIAVGDAGLSYYSYDLQTWSEMPVLNTSVFNRAVWLPADKRFYKLQGIIQGSIIVQ